MGMIQDSHGGVNLDPKRWTDRLSRNIG